MKTYLSGLIHDITLEHGTEKAFYLDIDDGRTTSDRNRKLWIPRSVCIIGEANENGWHDILIPQWIFQKNRIDHHRVCDINGKRLTTI